MAGVITWISVGGAVGYAICGRDIREMRGTLIAEIVVTAASGFAGGGLAALLWNHASTSVELRSVLLAALAAAATAAAVRTVVFHTPDRE